MPLAAAIDKIAENVIAFPRRRKEIEQAHFWLTDGAVSVARNKSFRFPFRLPSGDETWPTGTSSTRGIGRGTRIRADDDGRDTA